MRIQWILGLLLSDLCALQDVVDNVNDMTKSNDYFLLANDFTTYMKAQEEVDRIYRDQVRCFFARIKACPEWSDTR